MALESIQPAYVLGVDLGQTHDPTAICVLEQRRADIPSWSEPPMTGQLRVIHLERLPLATAYTAIPGRLQAIMSRLRDVWRREVGDGPFGDAPIRLVVDQTGVGRPVVDLLREHGLDPLGVTIHGGDQVLGVGANDWRVPKRTLVSSVQVALQTRRLQAAATLPDWPTLQAELANFKAKITLATGHDAYEAGDDWRSRSHDDLVLALALAVWASAAIGGSASLMAGAGPFVDDDDRPWRTTTRADETSYPEASFHRA